MIILSKASQNDVKKVCCPVCGGRLCDVKLSENIYLSESAIKSEIILKCHKCKSKIGVSMQNY